MASATRKSAARWASPRRRSSGTSTSSSTDSMSPIAPRRSSPPSNAASSICRDGAQLRNRRHPVESCQTVRSVDCRPGRLSAGGLLWLLDGQAAAPPAPDAPSRPDFYSRRVWQSSEGLPEDFTQALAQTPDGYLWIGTSGGLVRFDGVRFAVFNAGNEPAFRDDSVYSLLTPRDGTCGPAPRAAVSSAIARAHSARSAPPKASPIPSCASCSRIGRPTLGRDRQRSLSAGRRNPAPRRRPRRRAAMSVHAICEDREGRLLVGGTGLLVLNGGQRRPLQLHREPGRQQHPRPFAKRATARSGSGPSRAAPPRGRRSRRSIRGCRKLIDGTNISVLRRAGAATCGSARTAAA